MGEKRTEVNGKAVARTGDTLVPAEAAGESPTGGERLLRDIRALIEASRQKTARVVNSAMVLTYWSIGAGIQREVLGDERAEYGKQIIERLAENLTAHYGSGFSRANLFHMLRFAQAFPAAEAVQSLATRLTWTHFLQVIYLPDPVQREFYAQMCSVEGWSTRMLKKKIQGMLFERTAVSRKPEALAVKELEALREEDRMTPDLVFRDPYILDFLGLKDTYDERDLEEAILRELKRFIIELGTDFAFVGGIRVAEYITELPPREVLEAKLHAAIQAARERLEAKSQDSSLE